MTVIPEDKVCKERKAEKIVKSDKKTVKQDDPYDKK